MSDPEKMTCRVSPIYAGEDGDGNLESTDLFIAGRGISLLCNVPAGQGFTYTLIVDHQPVGAGWVGHADDEDAAG